VKKKRVLNNREWSIISSLSSLPGGDELIGDDCAYWEEKQLLLTTDHMVENHHFDFNFMPPETVGWRVMAANASDILAMGARPEFFLLNLAIPEKSYDVAEELVSGIKKFALQYDIKVMGGDTTGGDIFFIGITMIGRKGPSVWKRDGAKPGDRLFIGSYPGLSRAGFMHLKKGVQGFPNSKNRFLKPDPFLHLPSEKNENLEITSAIDISDSLISELTLISRFSAVSIEVDYDAIPLHEEVVESSKIHNIPIYDLLLGSGEEFFMIVTSPRDVPGFFEIGKIVEKQSEELIIKKDGSEFDWKKVSVFSHF